MQIKNNTWSIPSAFRRVPKTRVFLKGLAAATLSASGPSLKSAALFSRRDFICCPIKAREKSGVCTLWRELAQGRNSVSVTQDVRSKSLCVSCVLCSGRPWRVEIGRQLRSYYLGPPFPGSDFCKSNFQTILRTINVTQKRTLGKKKQTKTLSSHKRRGT